MKLNQKEIEQRFENFQQKIGIADIIESKSLLRMINAEDNGKIPMAHERILFATAAPEMKVISALGHFGLILSEQQDKRKNTNPKNSGLVNQI